MGFRGKQGTIRSGSAPQGDRGRMGRTAPHGLPVPVIPRRHARMRLPPEQGKGLVDSGPIIP